MANRRRALSNIVAAISEVEGVAGDAVNGISVVRSTAIEIYRQRLKKAYGLARIEGKTDKRAIRLTEAARRILLDAPDKEQLLKDAALTPSLHAELWKKYDGDPPADSVIRNYLLVDRDFNQNFVDSFISQFRKTIAFAGLSEDDTILAGNGEIVDDPDELDGNEDKPNAAMLEPIVKDKGKGGGATLLPKG